MGGAVNITARKPGAEFGGHVAVTAGNFERRDLRASMDLPITEQLRATFALSEKNRDGYVDRVLMGDRLGDDNEFAVRGVVLFEPSDALDFQLSVDRTEIDEQSAASVLNGFTPGAGTVGYALATYGDIGKGLADLAQYVTGGEGDITYATGASGTELDLDGISFTGTYHGIGWDLKYTFAHRETDGVFHRDPDNSPHAITETLNTAYHHEQATHELQLTGTAFDERLTYVAGLYAFDEEGTDNVYVPVFLPSPDLAVGFPAAIHNLADVDNDSQAAYLQLTWDLTDIFSITGGVRHTRDDKAFVYTHEVGLKWQGFDDRVRLNAAAFTSDYQDVQVTFFDSLGGPVTANSGSVDIAGLELELTALVTANLRLDVGYGYLDAGYDEINPIAGLSLTIDESAKLVNAPEHSFNAGVQYSILLQANELALRLDYAYTDDLFNDSQNSPFLYQKTYHTLNASLRFSMGESMDVVAFVANLTDERYIESGDSNFGLGFHEANFNRPREYGVTIRHRFQ